MKTFGNQKSTSLIAQVAAGLIMLLFGLSCNFVTRAFMPATPTATVSATPSVSATPRPSQTPVPTVTPSATALEVGLYIPAKCEGLPIATISPDLVQQQATPTLEPEFELSLADQTRILDDLNKVVSRVYLYPNFNGIDWNGEVNKVRVKVLSGMGTREFYDALDNLLQALKDDHSQYQSPGVVKQMDSELAGHADFVGIGVLIMPLIEKGSIVVLAVFPGSPAEHAGLKSHDSILAVDGYPVIKNQEANNWRIRGPECSATVLTVHSPGEQPRQVMLVRQRITTTVPIEAKLVDTNDGSRVGYILLPSFFDETYPDQVRKALEDWGPLDGLIIDNRINGGGSSTVVKPIMGFFSEGTLGNYVSREERIPFTIEAEPINNSQEVPLVILVGEDTVSYGEIFSGVLQNIGRAAVVGKNTLGNVEVLRSYEFLDGSRIWIAEERFEPSGSAVDWEKDGIKPDVAVESDWSTVTFETDPCLTAAIELLAKRK